VQVPKYIRWHYKLEPTQILEVTVRVFGLWHPHEIFLSRISKYGRIVIPKLTIAIFKDGKPNLDNYVAEVGLQFNLVNLSLLSLLSSSILFLFYF
jgi:bifunctional DNA-binding transcriptional regulator/antitoxin component of YhaV-PrlF toxin-antitoxin module